MSDTRTSATSGPTSGQAAGPIFGPAATSFLRWSRATLLGAVSMSCGLVVLLTIGGQTRVHAVMAVAHLAAALVVGLWLAAGERALWALVLLLSDAAGPGVRELASWYAEAVRGVTSLTTALGALAVALDHLARRGAVTLPRPTRHLARVVVRRGPTLLALAA